MILRVPIGAYGGGGPYHSGSVETTLLSVKGIKVVYPSNAADMKGLMKAAFYDPNPVVMLFTKKIFCVRRLMVLRMASKRSSVTMVEKFL